VLAAIKLAQCLVPEVHDGLVAVCDYYDDDQLQKMITCFPRLIKSKIYCPSSKIRFKNY